METLFTKIRDGKIPSKKIWSDELCYSILDINPVNKGHALVISNEPYRNIGECPDATLSHMILVAKKIEAKMREAFGCDGSNIMINNDPASGQEVPHLHIHVIPRYDNDGKGFKLAHCEYSEGEMDKVRALLETR